MNIFTEIKVPFAKMTLGGTIKVPTLEEDVDFEIPAGTQTGSKFKLREKGIQSIHGRTRGYLEFTVNVDIPKRLSDEQRKILTDFANTFGDEVKEKKKGFFGR